MKNFLLVLLVLFFAALCITPGLQATVSSTGVRVVYQGNGVTTAFAFPYYFVNGQDLLVYKRNNTTTLEILQTYNVSYTVAGAGLSAGGTVTFAGGAIPASGNSVVLIRGPVPTQGLGLADNRAIPVDLLETQLDYITLLDQRLGDLSGRSVRLTDGTTGSIDLTIPTTWPSAGGRLLGLNSTATGLSLYANIPGPTGATGATGATGSTGATGAAGTNGTNGTNGAGYSATSATSFSIGTGSKAFTTQAGLAYIVGDRVRIISTAGPTDYMEGVITAYAATTLTVLVDATSGSGTHTDWKFSIAGNVGNTGATGATGATGPQGSPGVGSSVLIQYNTGPTSSTTQINIIPPLYGSVSGGIATINVSSSQTSLANALVWGNGSGKIDVGWISTGTGSTNVPLGNDVRFPPAPSGAGKEIYDNGSAYVALNAGTANQVKRGGSAPTWGNVPLAAMQEVMSILDLSDVGAVSGSGTTVVLNLNPSITNLGVASYAAFTDNGAAGATGRLSRNGNALEYHDSVASRALVMTNDTRLPPVPSGAGKEPYDNGSAYVALAAGTSSQVKRGGSAPTWGAVPLAAAQEVIAIADLTDATAKTGTGTIVVMSASPAFTGTPTADNLTINAAGTLATDKITSTAGGALAIFSGGGNTDIDLRPSGTGNIENVGTGRFKDTNWSANGVLYADTNKLLQSTTVGTAAQILTSNGSGVAPTFQANAGLKFGVSLTPGGVEANGGANDPLLVGVPGTNASYSYMSLPDSVTTSCRWLIGGNLTRMYAGGQITFHIWHFLDTTTTSQNTRYQVKLVSLTDGDTIDTAYDGTTAHTLSDPNKAATTTINDGPVQWIPSAAEMTAGETTWVQVQRLGADVLDTNTGEDRIFMVTMTED